MLFDLGITLQGLKWFNKPLKAAEIGLLATQQPGLGAVAGNVSAPTTLSALLRSVDTTGTYTLNLNGRFYRVYVAVLPDDSKWVLVLNYLHKGHTSPELRVLGPNDQFPLFKSEELGQDGSRDPQTWGHLSPAFLKLLAPTELRFYGRCDGTNTIHFRTTHGPGLAYATTGRGGFGGQFPFTPMMGHTASIPGSAPNWFGDQGDYALTTFPFWRSGEAHWGIRGLDQRWEVDSYFPYQQTWFNTYHSVWVR